VCDAKRLAGQAVEEIACDGLARRETDGVDKAVETGPGPGEAVEHGLDLGIVGYVAIEDQL